MRVGVRSFGRYDVHVFAIDVAGLDTKAMHVIWNSDTRIERPCGWNSAVVLAVSVAAWSAGTKRCVFTAVWYHISSRSRLQDPVVP